MRIVLIGAAHPYRGGIAHFIARIYQELRCSHDVRIITFCRQYPRLLFPGQSQIEPDAGIFNVPAERRIDSLAPWSWLSASRSIAEWQPQIVVFNYWTPFFAPCFGCIARRIRSASRARVLFVCHNLLPHERRPGDSWLATWALRPAHTVLAISPAVESDLRKVVPAIPRIRLSHPAWDSFGGPVSKTEARKLLGIRHQRVILFFGFIRPYKGLQILLQAMPGIDPGLDMLLLVAGDFYEDRRKYDRAIEDLSLKGRVRIDAGYVPADRVRFYFSAADALVVPYVEATQSGIVQIAYNFLRPVIASDVPGLSQMVVPDKTGYLVPAGDPSALAEAVMRLFDEEVEIPFADGIRSENRRHSWRALCDAITSQGVGPT